MRGQEVELTVCLALDAPEYTAKELCVSVRLSLVGLRLETWRPPSGVYHMKHAGMPDDRTRLAQAEINLKGYAATKSASRGSS